MESHDATYSTTNNTSHDAINISDNDDTDVLRGTGKHNKSAAMLPSWFVVQLTLTASLGGCLFGYDMGAISGTLPQLTNTFDLTDRQKELTVSILYVGGALGACIGGSLCDRVGRKVTILLTDIVFIVGALLLYFASVYSEVVIGRFIVGIGVAVSGVADVSYLHECSPIEWRGSIVSVNEACISLGFLLAYIAGYMYADDGAEEWRIIFGMAGVLATIQFIGMLVLPESPAWLIEKGYNDDANRALERINGNSHCSTTNDDQYRGDHSSSVGGWDLSNQRPTLTAFRRRSKGKTHETHFNGESGLQRIDSKSPLRENELGDHGQKGNLDHLEESTGLVNYSKGNKIGFVASKWNQFKKMMRSTRLTLSRYRHQVYIALFLAVTQQFCGQTNILSYAPLIFAEAMKKDFENDENAGDGNNDAGVTEDLSMIIIGSVKFFVTVLVIWRIEYLGRRFLLILGNGLIAVGLLALVIAFGGSSNSGNADDDASWSPLTNIKTFHLALPGVLLVVSGYSMSFGPLTWLLTSEIFPTEIRGRALGYSTIISYTCGAISTETFLYTQSLLGPSFVFGIYCVITVAGALFAYLAIPDTGAKTVEQIDESLSRMYCWKYSGVALSQNDDDCLDGMPASEMVRNPSQLSLT